MKDSAASVSEQCHDEDGCMRLGYRAAEQSKHRNHKALPCWIANPRKCYRQLKRSEVDEDALRLPRDPIYEDPGAISQQRDPSCRYHNRSHAQHN